MSERETTRETTIKPDGGSTDRQTETEKKPEPTPKPAS